MELVGIFVFDQFGAFIKTIDIKDAGNIGIEQNNMICFRDQDSLCIFDPRDMEKKMVPLPDTSGIMTIEVAGNKLYLFKKREYDVYLKK